MIDSRLSCPKPGTVFLKLSVFKRLSIVTPSHSFYVFSVDSQCRTLPGTHDSTPFIVHAILKSKDPHVTLPNAYADSLERIIAAQFQAPPITSFMVVSSGTTIKRSAISAPSLTTHLYFYIRRDGSITEPVGVGMSLNSVWENALMDALETVAQRKLFPPLPKTVDADSVLTTYMVAGSFPSARIHPVLPAIEQPDSSSRVYRCRRECHSATLVYSSGDGRLCGEYQRQAPLSFHVKQIAARGGIEPPTRRVFSPYGPKRTAGTTAIPSGRRYACVPVVTITASSNSGPSCSFNHRRCFVSSSSTVALSLISMATTR